LKEENKKLKEENKKLKEENKKLKEKNNTCFYVYNPYTGVVSLREYDVIKVNNFKW
jgi:cell division protein FtsB